MSEPWGACERGPLVAFRLGATGLGIGAGCGVGLGFGTPLNVAGVPVLGSAAAGIGQGAGRVRHLLRGAEARLLRVLPAGASAGAGCGVGIGYGFGAGLFLKPSAGDALVRRAVAARDAILARLPPAVAAQLSACVAAPHAATAAAAPQRAPEASQADDALHATPQQQRRLEERVDQLSDSLAQLRAEQAALRAALCSHAAPPEWAAPFCERT